MKRIWSGIIAIMMMTVVLSSCGNSEKGTDTTSDSQTVETINTSGMATDNASSDAITTETQETTDSSVDTAQQTTESSDTEPLETVPPIDWNEVLPEKLYFLPHQTTTYDDGGYYAKFSTFTLEENGQNGLTVSSPNSDGDRCLWAFVNEVVDARPILHYELEEGSQIYKIEISRAWDIEMPIEIDVDPGTHSINLKEALEEHTITEGYSYVVIYTCGTANINNFYLGTE